MKRLIVCLLAASALSAAADTRTFTGTITDGECANADHSHMRMGSTDTECTIACVDAHGATYLLYDGKEAFTLSGKQLERFAAQKVRVVGTLDAKTKTIQVVSISAAR